jgi:hypothetical protein
MQLLRLVFFLLNLKIGYVWNFKIAEQVSVGYNCGTVEPKTNKKANICHEALPSMGNS